MSRSGRFVSRVFQLDWIWREAEQAGVPIYVLVKPSDVPLMMRSRRSIAGHARDGSLALPLNKIDDGAFRDLHNLLALAKRPNVAVKRQQPAGFINVSWIMGRVGDWLVWNA